MKIIGRILKFIISFILAAVIIIVGSFTAVFFMSKDEPQDIFILDYALITQKGEDEKLDIWFVEKTDSFDVEHGDGIVYYDGAYKSANAMYGFDGRVIYFDSDSLDKSVWVDDGAVVGRIIALWQQK